MSFVVYVLYSKKYDRFYVGFTQDLKRRLKEHNSGKTKSTKAYLPWVVVYTERVEERTQARKREKYLKSGVGREFIKKKYAQK